METGVARRPVADWDEYTEGLGRFVFRSAFVMKPIFNSAKIDPRRVIYADGEDERILRATQVVLEEGLAVPILVGRPEVVGARLKRYGISLEAGKDFELINPASDPRYRDYVLTLLSVAGRRGMTPEAARTLVRTNATVIGAVALQRGDADAMICGLEGRFQTRLRLIRDIVGLAPGVTELSALSLLITQRGNYFFADTHLRQDPTAAQIAEMAVRVSDHVRRLGIAPKVALVCDSDFGELDSPSALKMREARTLIQELDPALEVDGEMQADTALSEEIRARVLQGSTLHGEANVLILPNRDAANIAYQLVKVLADALPVGPILMGTAKPAHILTPSVTARGIVNMTAVAVAEAQALRAAG